MESVGVNLEVRNDPASLTFSIPERPHVSESGSLSEPPDNEANKQILWKRPGCLLKRSKKKKKRNEKTVKKV